MRTLPALCAGICLGFAHLAIAHPTSDVALKTGCKDFSAIAIHQRAPIADWVAPPSRHRVVRTDSAIIVNAAAPVGLIVGECGKPT
ncbi:ethanolamine utilization microcompartment shell protein EutS [Paraburkholderia sp. RAU6.4a]|uniref:hypothetical protein n=1 Tax=unclassified Paraburkholderia TaxID=2615204 RepID=UPI0016161F7E|nr:MULTISPECIES: hypothetical protein [unclassified Paraburkholderia]MBB5412818.1 ethanolamine utilization microcompartment shell protein EutS [Paraburkholderia sp. HC6.4b]MBB5454883.1 ethanolamine utilization microcompartment shell protein EutS [Paraburkholderia sp. Kb1A]